MEILNLVDKTSFDNSEKGLKITDIKATAKNDNRANIFINGDFAFSLDVAQIVDYRLKVGQQISQDELVKYRQASEFGKLYQSTLEWVLTKARSVKETRDYLHRKLARRKVENNVRAQNQKCTKEEKERFHLKTKILPLFTEKDIEEIIQRLIKKGYLDDMRFAQVYIENRNSTKGSSLKKLSLELTKKGVSTDIIKEVLSNTERNDEEEIRKIIAKKGNRYKDVNKLKTYLLRQGFSFSDIESALQS
ncbi:RecX family transcriptional regulator [Candidatus Saccharibacteria bacterium]|nr:RecX family transcriptional regulator [Candidatus Saccharibacteria bacterium]